MVKKRKIRKVKKIKQKIKEIISTNFIKTFESNLEKSAEDEEEKLIEKAPQRIREIAIIEKLPTSQNLSSERGPRQQAQKSDKSETPGENAEYKTIRSYQPNRQGSSNQKTYSSSALYQPVKIGENMNIPRIDALQRENQIQRTAFQRNPLSPGARNPIENQFQRQSPEQEMREQYQYKEKTPDLQERKKLRRELF